MKVQNRDALSLIVIVAARDREFDIGVPADGGVMDTGIDSRAHIVRHCTGYRGEKGEYC